MVELELETYTHETISAHKKIRQDFFCFSALHSLYGLILGRG